MKFSEKYGRSMRTALLSAEVVFIHVFAILWQETDIRKKRRCKCEISQTRKGDGNIFHAFHPCMGRLSFFRGFHAILQPYIMFWGGKARSLFPFVLSQKRKGRTDDIAPQPGDRPLSGFLNRSLMSF